MSDTHKIDSLFSAALSLKKAGEIEKAINLLDEIIQENPDFVDAYVLRGAIFQEEENFEEAEATFRKAVEFQPENAEALQGLGLFLVTQERYEESIPYLQRYLEMIPDDESSLDGILEAFWELPDRKDDILRVLQNAWDYSHDIDIGLRYGQHLTIFNDEKEDAYKVFNEILKISKTPETLTDFAFSCWFFDDYSKAIDLLQEAINIDQSFSRAWRLLAKCHYQLDNLSKALETIENAIALDPNDYQNWQLKTDIFVYKKEYDRALLCAENGVKLLQEDEEELNSLSDSWINPFFQKIFILFRLDQITEALEFSKVARELIPGNRHFYLYPAQKLASLDRSEEALEILNSTNDPELEQLFEPYQYRLLHEMGQAQEAWDYIFPKLQKAPDQKLDILSSVGVDLYSSGDRSTALTIYEQLLSFQPNNPRLMNNYGYIILGEGQIDEAESFFIKVIQAGHSDENTLISKCNLAYIFSIKNEFDQVFKLVEGIFSSEVSKLSATLRVPFWFQGEIHPDPAQYPGRSITLEMAALGCGIAAALAQSDFSKADELNDALLVKESEDPLPFICEACVQAAKGNQFETFDALTEAIKLSENEEEISILKNWVELLEQK